MSFQLILVSLVCADVRLTRIGEDKILNPNSKFLYPLFSLPLPRIRVSVQNFLDFRKISVSRQIWLKIQTPLFLKQFLGFVHHFEWIVINLFKFQDSMIIFI